MIIATYKQKMIDCLYRLMTTFIDNHPFNDGKLLMTFGLKNRNATISDSDMWCFLDEYDNDGYPYAFLEEAEVLRFAGMIKRAARLLEDYDCRVVCQSVLPSEDDDPHYLIKITLTIT